MADISGRSHFGNVYVSGRSHFGNVYVGIIFRKLRFLNWSKNVANYDFQKFKEFVIQIAVVFL